MSTVAVAGWIGAGNLGDELIASVVARELRCVGLRPLLLSLDPQATRAMHHVDAVHHLDVRRWVRCSDALIFGGGGLIQDRTSLLSPAYQLHRPLLARLSGMPVLGLGLGAEPMRRGNRSLTRAALSGAFGLYVRDLGSKAVLEGCRLTGVTAAADLVFLHEQPARRAGDAVLVSLVPTPSPRGLRPSWLRSGHPVADGVNHDCWARELDEVSRRLEAPIRFVSMDRRRDAPIHKAVARLMRRPNEVILPSPEQLLVEFSQARLVIGARFHAVVAAVVTGRPTVALGYAPKVVELAALASDLVELFPYAALPPPSLPDVAVRRVAAGPATSSGDRLREAAALQRAGLVGLAHRVT
jgi:polysaccharide pyruvyl transferase CsaB